MQRNAAGQCASLLHQLSPRHSYRHEHAWRLALPDYVFRSIGPHVVTLEGVRDAAQCEPVAPDPLFRQIWVDVAETAAIVPFDRRENYCAGDAIPFQLEGTPPWTIGCVSIGDFMKSDAVGG